MNFFKDRKINFIKKLRLILLINFLLFLTLSLLLSLFSRILDKKISKQNMTLKKIANNQRLKKIDEDKKNYREVKKLEEKSKELFKKEEIVKYGKIEKIFSLCPKNVMIEKLNISENKREIIFSTNQSKAAKEYFDRLEREFSIEIKRTEIDDNNEVFIIGLKEKEGSN